MFRSVSLMSVLAIAACTGTVNGGDDADDPDGGMMLPGQATLEITSPTDYSTFNRETLSSTGYLVAAVPLAARASADVARVVYYAEGQAVLGEASAPDFALDWEYLTEGDRWVRAVGLDAGGAEIAEATIHFTVAPANAADCYAWLDLYQLVYDMGPARQGIADPVTVTTPINGVQYRYVSNDNARTEFLMDCSLALSLAKAGPLLRERDVVEVADIGVYNYRCIGGGEPPDCPNGISQHAYAKAIDIAGVTTSDGTWYSVNDDWVIDDSATCAASTEDEKDAFLHELICTLKGENVWNIVLTPNYNSAHRNHFHVDLTFNADYIKRAISELPPIPVSELH